MAEFADNNKMHSVIKVSPFIVNYSRELRMEANIRRKGKVEKTIEFVKRMKKVQEKTGAALRKAQEEMKWQENRGEKKQKNRRESIK